MHFRFIGGELGRVAADVLLLPTFEGERLAAMAKDVDGLLSRAAQQEGFRAKADQSMVFHTHGKLGAERVLLLGLGPRSGYRPEALRQALGRGARLVAKLRASSAAVALPDPLDRPADVRAAVEGLVLGAYRFDRYRTGQLADGTGHRLGKVALWLSHAGSAEVRAAAELGERVGEAVNWARDLVNEPAGVMTPARLASEAKSLSSSGLRVSVSGRKEIEKLRMGLFLGVAQGSAFPPHLVQVRYTPRNPKHAKRAPLALVGKAITFDSGGLSLKTAEGMVDMKTDMAGSAAVLGAMQVVAHLKPPFPVHALLGACENMPSGTAYRPGDVLVSRLGKTVEVTNTDAEGRLVLGDMLSYAVEQHPCAIVDLATLTGACVVALGHYVGGAFGGDDALMADVLGAADAAGESFWRMPMTELQRDNLRSEVADMKNTGERWGAATTAALFLREFTSDVPWVHLDIAGPSQSPKERAYFTKGATGVGVRTLVELVRRRTAHLDHRA